MGSLTVVVSLVIAMWMLTAGANADRLTDETSKLMKKKLEHASEVLAGLANEDYERISRHAQSLDDLTRHQWLAREADDYRASMKVFRFANSELKRLADEKNLDGATLAYVQLTLSCVNCHRHLRQNQN